MGSDLRRQLREALGSDVDGLERALALELADNANCDELWQYDPYGRYGRVRLQDLSTWTGESADRVREAVALLRQRGWEIGVPLGARDELQFRIPDFEGSHRWGSD